MRPTRSDRDRWRELLGYNPLPPLLNAPSAPIRFFTLRDLTDERLGPAESLWTDPRALRLLRTQLPNGAWKYHGGQERIRSVDSYSQLETYRQLRVLIELFGMTQHHPAIGKAAEFLFSKQTDEGDFRGICGNQYIPYYSAAFLELLVKAGYARDGRVEKGFRWLESMRQEDGGWAFPLRTVGLKLGPRPFAANLIQPDRSMPSSHMVTGMVLRAFAAHPDHRRSGVARSAGRLLAARFFKRDAYADRQAPSFWTAFSFPFWFTDLLSSLDSLSWLGFRASDPQVRLGLEWLVRRQQESGLWRLPLRLMSQVDGPDHWISLAVCRAARRLAD